MMNDILACAQAIESWDAAYRAGTPGGGYKGYFGPRITPLEVISGEMVPIQEATDPTAPSIYVRWKIEEGDYQEGPTGNVQSELSRVGWSLVFSVFRQPGAAIGSSAEVCDDFWTHLGANTGTLNTTAVKFVPQATTWDLDDADDNDWPGVTCRVPYSSSEASA